MNIRFAPFAPNVLYYGDCLDVMADFPDSYIDLICLDPPFNSDEKYNKVFKDSGLLIDPQIKAFDDVWLWDKAFNAEKLQAYQSESNLLFADGMHPRDIVKTLHISVLTVRIWMDAAPF